MGISLRVWDFARWGSSWSSIAALCVLTASSAGAQSVASLAGAGDAGLVDAPSAIMARAGESGSRFVEDAGTTAVVSAGRERARSEAERNVECETGALRGKPCRVSWTRVIAESFFFLSTQHLGNIGMDADTRYNLARGTFWGDYAYCVSHYRWSRWKDDDPFAVDYIGHPMMGALTNSIYEQNDPKQRALMFENTRPYWIGRLRATGWTTIYSTQWKVGPLSEASIGNTGIGYYYSPRINRWTNETGMQDFFVTPVGGLAWNVGEDMLDRWVMTRVRARTHNRVLLLISAFATPLKGGANLSRFRAPYYRDTEPATKRSSVVR